MPWKVLDHDAEVALRIEGSSLRDLFAEAARGVASVVGDSPLGGAPAEYGAALEAAALEDLLHAFLSEVLFRLQTEGVYPLSIAWKDLSEAPPRLLANVAGARLPDSWAGRLEVKGVTYHDLEIRRTERGYAATVILDV